MRGKHVLYVSTTTTGFELHHVTFMLERCSYVRCLVIDFSKAFHLVDHPILGKLASLGLPDRAINWMMDHLVFDWAYPGC